VTPLDDVDVDVERRQPARNRPHHPHRPLPHRAPRRPTRPRRLPPAQHDAGRRGLTRFSARTLYRPQNATLARTLLADLVDRGLDPEQAVLFVIDGAKALRRAIEDVFGEHALVHRCHRHKERNVCDLLPEHGRDQMRARMRAAWSLTDAELARQRLELLASELERSWPDAAGSLREGMTDTLTLMRLGIGGQLAKTLCSTNPCESMIEIVRYTQRNVKHWKDGDMRKRWSAAGMLVAEQQFRRIIGYRDLATLVIAIERHHMRATDAAPVAPETAAPEVAATAV